MILHLLLRNPGSRLREFAEFGLVGRREPGTRCLLRSFDARFLELERLQQHRLDGFVHRRFPS